MLFYGQWSMVHRQYLPDARQQAITTVLRIIRVTGKFCLKRAVLERGAENHQEDIEAAEDQRRPGSQHNRNGRLEQDYPHVAGMADKPVWPAGSDGVPAIGLNADDLREELIVGDRPWKQGIPEQTDRQSRQLNSDRESPRPSKALIQTGDDVARSLYGTVEAVDDEVPRFGALGRRETLRRQVRKLPEYDDPSPPSSTRSRPAPPMPATSRASRRTRTGSPPADEAQDAVQEIPRD